MTSELMKCPDCKEVKIPVSTLKWWRELVDLNPQDLAPRIDAYLRKAQQTQ